jgi:hypothetical protein
MSSIHDWSHSRSRHIEWCAGQKILRETGDQNLRIRTDLEDAMKKLGEKWLCEDKVLINSWDGELRTLAKLRSNAAIDSSPQFEGHGPLPW